MTPGPQRPATMTRVVVASDQMYGKGIQAAGLNICDCPAYSLARSQRLPLLYQGEDCGDICLSSAARKDDNSRFIRANGRHRESENDGRGARGMSEQRALGCPYPRPKNSRAVSTVRAMSASLCAAEMNPASNCDGAR